MPSRKSPSDVTYPQGPVLQLPACLAQAVPPSLCGAARGTAGAVVRGAGLGDIPGRERGVGVRELCPRRGLALSGLGQKHPFPQAERRFCLSNQRGTAGFPWDKGV